MPNGFGAAISITPGAVESLSARVAHLRCTPPTVSATAIKAATAMGAGAVVSTGFTQPTVPCVLTYTGSAGATGELIAYGKDVDGGDISESVNLASGLVNGTKVFASITSYDPPAGGAETVSIGNSKKIGLPHALPHSTKLLAFFDNAADAGDITPSALVLAGNYVTIAGTPNSAKVYDLYYLV